MSIKKQHMCLIFLTLFLHSVITSHVLLIKNEHYDNDQVFIFKHIENVLLNRSQILILHSLKYNDYIFFEKAFSTRTIIIFEGTPKSINNKLDLIILFLDDLKTFHDDLISFKFIKYLSILKFFIVYFGIDHCSKIFYSAWNYSIINIDVITKTGIYTYFPFKNGSCKNIIPESLKLNTLDYFPQKVPNDLGNCPIRLLAYPMEPYVINTFESDYDNPRIAGLEVTIIRTVTSKMNLNPLFINHSHKHWGFKYPNGSYTLMYNDLYEKKADIMFGFLYGNSTYNIDFDHSNCHLLDPSVWWVPVALPIPLWENIIAIFDVSLWFSTIATIPVVGFTWCCIGRKQEKQYSDVTICILNAFLMLLQGSVESPILFINKSMFFTWSIASLLLFTAYQSQLVSILTKSVYRHQISNLEELVSSDLRIGFYPTVAQGFNESHNWVHEKILNTYIPCPLTNECINKTAFDKDFATFKNQRSGLYLIPKYFTFPDGRPMLFKFDEFGILSVIRFITVKNWPLLERLNSILMQLQANGLISKWDRDIKYMNKFSEQQKLNILSLNHLLSAFYVLTVGITLSCFVFLIEVIHKYT